MKRRKVVTRQTARKSSKAGHLNLTRIISSREDTIEKTNEKKSTNTDEFLTDDQSSVTTIESNNQDLQINKQARISNSLSPIINEDSNSEILTPEVEEETVWVSNDTVFAYKYKFKIGVTDKDKIAAFDLDGTLITTKSNNKFSRDINDWKFLDVSLKKKIEEAVQNGFNFVIFSNQMGVSRKFISLNQIKKKIENVVKLIGVPCVALFCTHLDKFRKPAIGMFDFYKTINKTKIDLQNSFYVGDAMGRQKDHSAADLLFSYNLKMPFISIEEYLNRIVQFKPKLYKFEELKKFRIPKYPNLNTDPKITKISIKCGESENVDAEVCFMSELIYHIELLVDEKDKSVLILLIGLYGSGKTFFYKHYLEDKNYNRITDGNFEEQKKIFLNYAKDNLEKNRIVIDQPNLDFATRKNWIELAKEMGYEVVAIHFDLDVEHCLHNVRFRSFFTDPVKNHNYQIEKDILKQHLKLSKPEYFEGFVVIFQLNFIESFGSDDLLKCYYTHYLSDKP